MRTRAKPVIMLEWAKAIPTPYWYKDPVVGSALGGLQFEQRIIKHLGDRCIHRQWFEFKDMNGIRQCEIDILFEFQPGIMIVIEARSHLIGMTEGRLQRIYGPVVEMAYQCSTKLVIIFRTASGKYWLPANRVCSDIEDVVNAPFGHHQTALINWEGQSLLPSQLPPEPLREINPRTAAIIGWLGQRS